MNTGIYKSQMAQSLIWFTIVWYALVSFIPAGMVDGAKAAAAFPGFWLKKKIAVFKLWVQTKVTELYTLYPVLATEIWLTHPQPLNLIWSKKFATLVSF